MIRLRLLHTTLLVSLLAACTSATPSPTPTSVPPTAEPSPTVPAATATPAGPIYPDPSVPVDQRVEDLLSRMSLAEKIGQMTLVEKNSIKPDDITNLFIGGLLSGGGGSPSSNTAADWAKMTNGFQKLALKTPLAIPLIYGVDAVHGHGNLFGATIFPHNIGLGATRDADLMQKIGRATAEEVAATGIWWNYGPVVAVPQDIRWGRTYEGYSENTDVVSTLASAYIHGLQEKDGKVLGDPLTVLATAKHFIGDGGTAWGSSKSGSYKIDQGDMKVDEATLDTLYLPPYQAAIDAGAQSIMVSFSSWQGTKMHAQKHLLTDVLKGQMGFKGFLVSDWQAIDQIDPDYYKDVVISINAGLDMIMVPTNYMQFITDLTKAVEKGDVSQDRIDDAVRRILRAKFEMGLFEHPLSDPANLALVGSDAHRELARQAVSESVVLLKNDNQTLPLAKDTPVIFVSGPAADDIGIQSGGWTIQWQGLAGNITPGTTILQGLTQVFGSAAQLHFNRNGSFINVLDAQNNPVKADVGIVVLGENPYAEGVGDSANLALNGGTLLDSMREHADKVILIVVSGRPVIITDLLPKADAVVAAWLPGTEGQGVADVLSGDKPFTGKLAYTWPRSISQLPFDFKNLATIGCDAPLFPFGYGLTTTDASPAIPECPAP